MQSRIQLEVMKMSQRQKGAQVSLIDLNLTL